MNCKTLTLGTVLTLSASLALIGCGDNSTPPATAPATAPASSDANVVVNKLLADTQQYIKDNKWDLADKGVNELVAMKPKLTPENAKRVDDLKSAFDMAKAATRAAPKIP